jgi:hypothetical protein
MSIDKPVSARTLRRLEKLLTIKLDVISERLRVLELQVAKIPTAYPAWTPENELALRQGIRDAEASRRSAQPTDGSDPSPKGPHRQAR